MRASAVVPYTQVSASASIMMTSAEARLMGGAVRPAAIPHRQIMAIASALLGLCLVLAQPEQINVSAAYVEEISAGEVVVMSNFITSDWRYLMTADGRIFFVRQ